MNSLNLQENIPLAKFSSFKIGGPARYFAEIRTFLDAQQALQWALKDKIPFFVLGKGSNCLFDDRGFNGLILYNRLNHYILEDTFIRVGSGFSFASLGKRASRQSLTGLEFASGIPGTVGGAICMNAGANGQETVDCMLNVVFLKENGEIDSLSKEEGQFSYRTSRFQKEKGMILEASFALRRDETAAKRQQEFLQYRLKTQPYKIPSAGCIFRNHDLHKAGQLIEELGLKGKRIGGAEVSPLHGNFIVNQGNATAKDVLQLIELLQSSIKKKTGELLHLEVRAIPYELENDYV